MAVSPFMVGVLLSCASPSTCPDYTLTTINELPFADLHEASGMAISGDETLIWLHNDGPENVLYVVDRAGNAVAQISLLGTTPTDAEDLASAVIDGQQTLVLADIGDNQANRADITLYTVTTPALAVGGEPINSVLTPTSATYYFPDNPTNAESLAYDPIDAHMYLLTKSNTGATLYQIPDDDDTLITVQSYPSIASATAMAISPDGLIIVVTSHDGALVWHRQDQEPLADILTNTPCRLPLPDIDKVESVAVTNDGTLIFTGEGVFSPLVEATPDYAQ